MIAMWVCLGLIGTVVLPYGVRVWRDDAWMERNHIGDETP